MDRVILIKYGELSTKKGNRNFFINTLYNNVKNKLSEFDVKINKDRARMLIRFREEDLNNIIDIVNKIFGIHSYSIAYVCESDEESIKNCVMDVINNKEFTTFKIETKRSNKNFPIHSQDFNRVLGTMILKSNSNYKVDVHNPDLLLKVEIRDDATYVYYDTMYGAGGYPIGTQPRGLLMLSGGIDSPVAGYMALKRGVVVDAVYFEAIPHTSLEAREKVITLSRKLAKYTNNINLHIVNFTPIQEEIYKNCREDYCITIMRRMMYRIMEKLSVKYDAKVIINGESIGQVASQTLTSMSVINSVTSEPVIRPLACMDKLEIMDIARKIDTYETSILPYEDCCTVFVPRHPAINPSLETAIKEENKFDFEKLIEEAVLNMNTIKIIDEEENEFKELL